MLRPLTAVTVLGGLAAPLATQVTFTDQTVAAGIDHEYSPGVFTHAFYAGGGAVGDFDADGSQDLFLLSGRDSAKPDSLYLNQGDGTFSLESAAWGLSQVHDGKGLAVADYDDDGDVDVYLTSAGSAAGGQPGKHQLLQNSGSGFVDVAAQAGVKFTTTINEDGWGSAFGDYDLDGDLDLCVGGFAPGNVGTILFQNQGDGTFTNVNQQIGLFSGTSIQLKVFAPRFADMDGDGYPELLLAADFGTSAYFRNDTDGRFTDVTAQAGVGQDENGMGQVVRDFNGDGLLDWYVTSIYLPIINWTGNKLYLNQGNHSYLDVAAASGCDDGGYGWGAVGVDFDHDGDLDIAAADGSNDPDFKNEQAYLWMNDAALNFSEEALASGFVHTGQSRGMLDLDYDGDGDSDVVVLANDEPAVLFRNETVTPTSSGGSWLRVFLETGDDPTLAPGGYGAVVRATAGGVTQMRSISGGDNFMSQSELSAHFGLGSAQFVDLLEVTWSNGLTTSLANVAVDQVLTLEPPSPWTNLGGASPGTLGVPGLTMKGPLLPGSPVLFESSNLQPGTVGIHFVGLSPLGLPLAGGVLIPALDVYFGVIPSAQGEASLQVPWPAGATPGTTIWVQTWMLDGGGVDGLASSPGYSGVGN